MKTHHNTQLRIPCRVVTSRLFSLCILWVLAGLISACDDPQKKQITREEAPPFESCLALNATLKEVCCETLPPVASIQPDPLLIDEVTILTSCEGRSISARCVRDVETSFTDRALGEATEWSVAPTGRCASLIERWTALDREVEDGCPPLSCDTPSQDIDSPLLTCAAVEEMASESCVQLLDADAVISRFSSLDVSPLWSVDEPFVRPQVSGPLADPPPQLTQRARRADRRRPLTQLRVQWPASWMRFHLAEGALQSALQQSTWPGWTCSPERLNCERGWPSALMAPLESLSVADETNLHVRLLSDQSGEESLSVALDRMRVGPIDVQGNDGGWFIEEVRRRQIHFRDATFSLIPNHDPQRENGYRTHLSESERRGQYLDHVKLYWDVSPGLCRALNDRRSEGHLEEEINLEYATRRFEVSDPRSTRTACICHAENSLEPWIPFCIQDAEQQNARDPLLTYGEGTGIPLPDPLFGRCALRLSPTERAQPTPDFFGLRLSPEALNSTLPGPNTLDWSMVSETIQSWGCRGVVSETATPFVGFKIELPIDWGALRFSPLSDRVTLSATAPTIFYTLTRWLKHFFEGTWETRQLATLFTSSPIAELSLKIPMDPDLSAEIDFDQQTLTAYVVLKRDRAGAPPVVGLRRMTLSQIRPLLDLPSRTLPSPDVACAVSDSDGEPTECPPPMREALSSAIVGAYTHRLHERVLSFVSHLGILGLQEEDRVTGLGPLSALIDQVTSALLRRPTTLDSRAHPWRGDPSLWGPAGGLCSLLNEPDFMCPVASAILGQLNLSRVGAQTHEYSVDLFDDPKALSLPAPPLYHCLASDSPPSLNEVSSIALRRPSIDLREPDVFEPGSTSEESSTPRAQSGWHAQCALAWDLEPKRITSHIERLGDEGETPEVLGEGALLFQPTWQTQRALNDAFACVDASACDPQSRGEGGFGLTREGVRARADIALCGVISDLWGQVDGRWRSLLDLLLSPADEAETRLPSLWVERLLGHHMIDGALNPEDIVSRLRRCPRTLALSDISPPSELIEAPNRCDLDHECPTLPGCVSPRCEEGRCAPIDESDCTPHLSCEGGEITAFSSEYAQELEAPTTLRHLEARDAPFRDREDFTMIMLAPQGLSSEGDAEETNDALSPLGLTVKITREAQEAWLTLSELKRGPQGHRELDQIPTLRISPSGVLLPIDDPIPEAIGVLWAPVLASRPLPRAVDETSEGDLERELILSWVGGVSEERARLWFIRLSASTFAPLSPPTPLSPEGIIYGEARATSWGLTAAWVRPSGSSSIAREDDEQRLEWARVTQEGQVMSVRVATGRFQDIHLSLPALETETNPASPFGEALGWITEGGGVYMTRWRAAELDSSLDERPDPLLYTSQLSTHVTSALELTLSPTSDSERRGWLILWRDEKRTLWSVGVNDDLSAIAPPQFQGDAYAFFARSIQPLASASIQAIDETSTEVIALITKEVPGGERGDHGLYARSLSPSGHFQEESIISDPLFGRHQVERAYGVDRIESAHDPDPTSTSSSGHFAVAWRRGDKRGVYYKPHRLECAQERSDED